MGKYAWPLLAQEEKGQCRAGQVGKSPVAKGSRVRQQEAVGNIYFCASALPLLLRNPSFGSSS